MKKREKKTTSDTVVDECHQSQFDPTAIFLDNFPSHTHMMYLSFVFIFLYCF